MPTAHISASPGDFAPDVLLPGDPRRAAFIAERYLADARQVTDVRGILGFTGTVDGRPMSVMASGMGIPSLSIYATELVRHYGVSRIVRVGTSGGMTAAVRVGDIVVASAAHTDSGLASLDTDGVSLSYAPDPELLVAAITEGRRLGPTVHAGPVFSTDFFYSPLPDRMDRLRGLGTLAVEMEAAGLYAVGYREGVKTLTITTVVDHALGGQELDAREREQQFAACVELAIATLHSEAADPRP